MAELTKEDLRQGKGLRCPACGDRDIVRLTRNEEHTIRGVPVTVDCVLRQCQACGAEFEFSGDPDWCEEAFAKYRESRGFLTPAAIRAWREAWGLTQQEVTQLLGWGGATLGRYENGSLQTEAHEQQLRGLMQPAALLAAIQAHGEIFPTKKRDRLIADLRDEAMAERLREVMALACADGDTPSAWNGQRRMDWARLTASILILLGQGTLKTKFNKLMFYADFLHFRAFGAGITGWRYVRLPHGPVPDEFQTLIAALVEAGVIDIREEDYGDGFVGERLVPLMDPDPTVLDDGEIATLTRVQRHFASWSSTRISAASHDEPAWCETAHRQPIAYDYAHRLHVKID